MFRNWFEVIYRGGIVLLLVCAQAGLALAQLPNLDPSFDNPEPLYPAGFVLDTLFMAEFHTVITRSGELAPAKGKHDFAGIFPIGTDRYSVFVSHEETNTPDSIIGDGGGMTAFKMSKAAGHWIVERDRGQRFFALDFEPVGNTNRNCGGALTPYGTLLSAEEDYPRSNDEIWDDGEGFSDTSDFVIPSGSGPYAGDTLERFENFGWMVEINPANGKVLRKLYSMGRFSHESAICSPNGKDVVLIEDEFPSLLWKFEADVPFDYSDGTLYAYKQDASGNGGEWMEMGRSMDTMLNCHKYAVSMGATLFLNLEWVTRVPQVGGFLFIAESGKDFAPVKFALNQGGHLAKHLLQFDTLGGFPADSTIHDYYGRILKLNLATLHIESYLEGGTLPSDTTLNFANPDALTSVLIDSKPYLVIQEDISSGKYNRMPAGPDMNNNVCELYMVRVNTPTASLEDLQRVFIGPNGAELSGATFTEDGNTMVLNIMHPSQFNNFPYNRDITVALSGFLDLLAPAPKESAAKPEFMLFPNPASTQIQFSTTLPYCTVTNSAGEILMQESNVKSLDISHLPAGLYQVESDGIVRSFVTSR